MYHIFILKNGSVEEKVAIKAINLQRLNSKLAENLTSEITIMRHISHAHIVKLLDLQKNERIHHLYMIMEYCEGGDLARLLRKQRIIPERVVKTMVVQLAAALQTLHSQNIIHRDLKPHNLLLVRPYKEDEEVILKVADFGFARSMLPSDLAQTLCGSPLYMVICPGSSELRLLGARGIEGRKVRRKGRSLVSGSDHVRVAVWQASLPSTESHSTAAAD